MPQMQEITILHDIEPALPDGRLGGAEQALVLVQRLDQLEQDRLRFARRGRDHGPDLVGLMGAVQHTEDFAHRRAEKTLIESDRYGLPLDRMENAQAAVGDGGGFRRVGREVPLKAPVGFTSAANMLFEIGAGVHQFRIGIFQPPLPVGVIQRGAFREDIADGRIDGAGQ